MRIRFALCAPTALGHCLLLSLPAFPQSGSIGPSKGEVIGGIAAAPPSSASWATSSIIHETHKHPTITGCLASNADGLSLTNEKDKKVYTLAGNLAALQAGKMLVIKGKKVKDSAGKLSFQLEKLTKDLGACQP